MKSFFSFLFNKKASSQMWWIIIGAVIALVVMIVLMVMFTDKSGAIGEGLLECTSKGGKCGIDKEDCDGTWSNVFECPRDGNIEKGCCMGKAKTQ